MVMITFIEELVTNNGNLMVYSPTRPNQVTTQFYVLEANISLAELRLIINTQNRPVITVPCLGLKKSLC